MTSFQAPMPRFASIGAYAALAQWCAANGRHQTGTSWEVYGDWADDPEQRRTDIYLLLA